MVVFNVNKFNKKFQEILDSTLTEFIESSMMISDEHFNELV